jgi:hypothetical protein
MSELSEQTLEEVDRHLARLGLTRKSPAVNQWLQSRHLPLDFAGLDRHQLRELEYFLSRCE